MKTRFGGQYYSARFVQLGSYAVSRLRDVTASYSLLWWLEYSCKLQLSTLPTLYWTPFSSKAYCTDYFGKLHAPR